MSLLAPFPVHDEAALLMKDMTGVRCSGFSAAAVAGGSLSLSSMTDHSSSELIVEHRTITSRQSSSMPWTASLCSRGLFEQVFHRRDAFSIEQFLQNEEFARTTPAGSWSLAAAMRVSSM